jgi:phenylacetate-CoA ligase
VTTAALPRDLEPSLTPPDIERLLNEGVAATVQYARERSPFYRDYFAGLPGVRDVADLAKLPVTRKQHVSEAGERFWCVPREGLIDIATTSGTTGVPTLYPLTPADLSRLGFNECLCFRRVGLQPGDVVILAVTIDKCFMAGLAYFEGLRQLGVTAVRVGAGSPAMLLSMMTRLRATAVVSVPSFLDRVAAYAQQQGIDLAQSTVKMLICIGEPVRDSSFQPTPAAARVAAAWGAQLYSTYGITELATSFCECSAGRGGHLHPQLLHAEILDDAGNAVPDGQVGQLVATTVGVAAMPLVRFATGDMTFLTRERCSCGLHTPRLGPILGRRDQAMKLKGTTVYPAAVQRSLQGVEQIVDYLLIATSPSPLSDELEVVFAWRGHSSGAEEIVREKLRGDLKVCPAVRLATTAELQSLHDSRELRKQRVFLDRRSKQGD